MLTLSDVAQHASRDSCWVVIGGTAYDLTSFLDDHPGGASILLRVAGRDATEAFEAYHSPSIIKQHLGVQQNLGPVSDAASYVAMADRKQAASAPPSELIALRLKVAPLRGIFCIRDFEAAAEKVLKPEAFSFYRTGADDEATFARNRASWQQVRFRPRILRPLGAAPVDLATTLLGNRFAAPFFICPAGGGKLANPEGEVVLTRAAARHGILQWVCNAAGCTLTEMADAKAPEQVLYWQIYVMKDMRITEDEIRTALARGYRGFALTVDAVVAGNRERDKRASAAAAAAAGTGGDDDDADGGISAIRPPVHADFDWAKAVQWIRTLTDLPVAIKGIQTWEDAAMCLQFPDVHPWLSNHGGRQLEGAPTALDTLLEIRQHCPQVLAQREVIVDGGVTRGTDIVKALCLGARAVGLGRPFLYALALGDRGVAKAIRILTQEVTTTMALLGVTRVADLGPQYVAEVPMARL